MDEQHLPLEQRLLIVSETLRLTERAFIHWDDALYKSDELDHIAKAYFEKAAAASTRLEFQKVMWELFGGLRNGHSYYSDKLAPAPMNGRLGFSLFLLQDQWVVNVDLTGMLTPGDLVVSIDGKHPSEWCNELEPYTGLANKISQTVRLNQFLPYFISKKSIAIEIEDQHHSKRTILLQLLADTDERFNKLNQPSATEGKWLQDGKTAYIRIPSFGESKYEQAALEFVKMYGQADFLIIDVRGNGGGSTPNELTRQLMDRPYRWWIERSRHPEWLSKRHGSKELRFGENYHYAEWHPGWQQPAHENECYEGQIILLADRYTGSAAEDFMMAFKDNSRATIVGERTWGSTGMPIFRHFGDDIHIGIGSIRAYMPNGDAFEGVGIAPDVEVAYTRDDLYNKRDAVLESAIELIGSKISGLS
ncbi:hypothetical protein EBB07_11860 [Paenibacillaceae bacterium]|nr:hypothetical protein EBB07_11860 [Paenibacillaceae bacterium]